jgi:hypothetical protein
MARGRLLRTKVKEEKALTKARIETEFKTTAKMKASESGFFVSLRDHVGRAIDRVDPLEIAAVGSLTVLIHETILHDPSILTQISNVFSTTTTVISKPWYAWLGGIAGYFGLGFLFAPESYIETTTTTPEAKPLESKLTDIALLWILSFAIAFIIARHFGNIVAGVGSAVGGLVGIIKLLIPILA